MENKKSPCTFEGVQGQTLKEHIYYKPTFWFVLAAIIMFTTQHIFDPLIWNSGLIGGYATCLGCVAAGLCLLHERWF